MLSDLFVVLADTQPEGLAAYGMKFLSWTQAVVGIGLVIFVHELGHFVAAKMFGVKCEKFYVGFDPPIKIGPIKLPSALGKFRYGETEYGIGIIPLGGYVKMLGQDDDPRRMKQEAERARRADSEQGEDDDTVETEPADEQADADQHSLASEQAANQSLDPRSLPAKPVWQRMIIMSAGVFMNVATGMIFAAAAFFYGVPYTPAIIGGVTAGGPAWQAGIEPGGKVVSIDGLDDEKLHFREMRSAIVHAGLEEPDQPIPLTVGYDGDARKYKLTTAPHPVRTSYRVIGITSPTSTTLSDADHAAFGSVAEQVLSEEDLGARVISFAGRPINEDLLVPSTPFLDYLYTHPEEPIDLVLRRVDGTEHPVTLPPQTSKWIGVRSAVGPVSALVSGGPAEQAGLRVGDQITAIGNASSSQQLDAEELLLALAKQEPISLVVQRNDESRSIEIKPDSSPQTLAPTSMFGGEASINAYGFAFRMPPVVAGFDASALVDGEPLQPGDTLQEVVLLPGNDFPSQYDEEPLNAAVEELSKAWEFDKAKTFSALLESMQFLPAGTRVKVLAERADSGVIVESTLQLIDDDRFRFERGLGLLASESIQTASSVQEAFALGFRESKRRLGDVFRFLRMLVGGRVGADQVGGPIRIFQVAELEAERGISSQLLFLTLLSMNLAVLNFLPIPVLDGGHMVFLICEAVLGRRVNEELEMRLTLVGGLMLLALMVFVFFNDLINI